MARRKSGDKFNDSCVKMFNLLGLLSNGTADFADVIELFRDDEGKLTQKSNVTLNKYMNTLKIFGIEVKKNKNKYYLMKMPFSINLDEDGLYAVALMNSAMSYMPNGKNKTSIKQFINNLQKRYDYSTKKLDLVVSQMRNYDLSFYFTKFEKQIEKCEQYCQDGLKLDIKYYSKMDDTDYDILCVPLEVKYQKDNVCFCVYCPLKGQILDLPMGAIKHIKQLSSKADGSKYCTTVVFKIKGDLIKRYKLREHEYSNGIDEDGYMTIVNSGEDFSSLVTRLFKYDKDCIVVSPKYLKNQLIKNIDKTLKNYI